MNPEFNQEFTDYALQSYYRKKLRLDKYAYAMKKLNSQAWCSTRLTKIRGLTPSVLLLKNRVTAKFEGLQSCKSPWSCPVCSARRMARESSRIASAIEALYKQYGEAGFMITFSVPHYHNFSCKQVYEILKETWKQFVQQGKSKNRIGAFCKFNNEFNCTHRIRVCEFTWGHYGWHPHFHCLFFVPKDRLQEVKNWQEALSERWFELTRRAAKKILKRDNYCEDVDKFIDDYFAKSAHSRGVPDAVISLTEDGKVRRAVTSDYICGWGSNKELTGNIRKEASHKGHFTPHQILCKAKELDNETLDDEKADKYFDLYIEYALATFKTYRIKMSPSLKNIIEQWQETKEYREEIKKKSKIEGPWQVVCWFTKLQWYAICVRDLQSKILQLAMQNNGKQLIEQLLLQYNIDITRNGRHYLQSWFEGVYNRETPEELLQYPTDYDALRNMHNIMKYEEEHIEKFDPRIFKKNWVA